MKKGSENSGVALDVESMQMKPEMCGHLGPCCEVIPPQVRGVSQGAPSALEESEPADLLGLGAVLRHVKQLLWSFFMSLPQGATLVARGLRLRVRLSQMLSGASSISSEASQDL